MLVMKNIKAIVLFVFVVVLFVGCGEKSAGTPEDQDPTPQTGDVVLIKGDVISSGFIGNGAQWGGYEIVEDWLNEPTLSDSDWDRLFARVDFMRPPFLRVMTTSEWSYDNSGTYDPDHRTKSLFKILDYCQSRDITVMFGEWGHHYLEGDLTNIDSDWVKTSVKFINYLVNDKGYSCIKHLNIVNEPNGDWSSTDGNYTVWKNVQLQFIEEMENYSLDGVKIAGPDVAVWDSNSTNWLTRASDDLGSNFELFDIHTYPEQTTVRSGDYSNLLAAYRSVAPSGTKIVLGEIGFKYESIDQTLKAENQDKIAADKYSGDDSNMMVYESFYGIDMADAIIQTMREGYSGALVWDMDDAMYSSPTTDTSKSRVLKRWGFWNILGSELAGDSSDEAIRPWFYPVSLLCRYFPAGSEIYAVDLPDKKGVRAVVAKSGNSYSIALVNSHYVDYDIVLKAEGISKITVDKYRFKAENDAAFEGVVDADGFASPVESGVSLDLSTGDSISLTAQTFILLTNM